MMKINSGIFRNSSIEILKNSSFRPTTSICRKSFFDTIGSLNDKSFLDIFAGSGIIGFEAASRGAKNVTFVEINKIGSTFFEVTTVMAFNYFKKIC